MAKQIKDDEGTEFDIHIWCKPESETMSALYTVSIGKRAICIDMTIDGALEHIRELMEE
jgi:hypothetical protein